MKLSDPETWRKVGTDLKHRADSGYHGVTLHVVAPTTHLPTTKCLNVLA